MKLVLFLLLGLGIFCQAQEPYSVPCYDTEGGAQRCFPEFENAAFNLSVEATNTCGEYRDIRYCRQTGVHSSRGRGQCYTCARGSHPARYLTDFHNEERPTRWQSETMYQGIQYPNSVNLTIHLGKSFEITYIRLKFYSPRPESFAIYKRTCQECPWIPYQYYSGSCRSTYGLPDSNYVSPFDEQAALCTSEYSDISPLTGGNIAFSTLTNRPSAREFDTSAVLQDWVTATDILVMLTRLNTFGDEVFRVPNVLRSYFYAITDFSIGGRCKCNGHASRCVMAPNDPYNRLVCQCEHNTAGPDCGECLPLYNDRQWRRATADSANECMRCNCNAHSDRCFFDESLYNRTGSGGHCLQCRDNTAGVNCERCRDNYYRTTASDRCQPCNCDQTGSLNLQCDSSGRCQCKVGVGGEKCNQCLPNYYDFGEGGCRSCECVRAGSLGNTPDCNQGTGRCNCKLNVEGRNCETCKPGFFNLQESDEYGCLPCFCHGHSSSCSSAPGYDVAFIESNFATGTDGWVARSRSGSEEYLVYNAIRQDIAIATADRQVLYFSAPDEFLGNKLSSYGQELSFQLRLGSDDVSISVEDVVLEGDGRQLSIPLVAQGNPNPGVYPQTYTYKLRVEDSMGWVQRPSAYDFQRVLSNLTNISIRATYTNQGQGFLDNVRLVSAERAVGPEGVRATFIELCSCPTGYVGQFCESCAAGFRRDPYGNDGPYTRCIPCECNGHADYCDVDTGRCICQHNTQGNNCERCADGYYGNALNGTAYDCRPCPCPGGSNCIVDRFGEVVCTSCPEGYVGNRCEYCADGYYGDPSGIMGPRRECRQCYCNYNIDPNAVANCDRFTGECLKCIFNTRGSECQYCLPGYYGNALGTPKGEQCQPCNCYPPGAVSNECDQTTGQCRCRPNVGGRNCSECSYGYWNIDSGRGCESCFCDRVGSTSDQCDIGSGQCPCKPGVTGLRCDQCEYDHYGFSYQGCTACGCHPQGSVSASCTEEGVCDCRPGVIGDKCDSCQENYYNIALGCIRCPECYNLVQERVTVHRRDIHNVTEKIRKFLENPEWENDEDFDRRLRTLENELNQTIYEAENASSDDDVLAERLNAIKDALSELQSALARISGNLTEASRTMSGADGDVEVVNQIIERLKRALANAQDYLDREGIAELNRLTALSRNMSDQEREMQRLALEAQDLANNHSSLANTIENTAQEALQISYQALNAARNSGSGGDVEGMVRQVESRFDEASALFREVEDEAAECQRRATQAAADALALLTKSNQPLSPIDVNALLDTARQLYDRASEIMRLANELRQANQEELRQVAAGIQNATRLLRQGKDAEAAVALLLARADNALAIAKEAKKKGDETLAEARNILAELQRFNEKIEESKQEAEVAKLRIPDIEAMIDLANRTALNASAAIEAAEGDAMKARDYANQAESNATKASQNARQVKTDADATMIEAQNQNDRADGLTEDAMATMMRLNAIDAQANATTELVTEAQQKAGAAQQATADAKKTTTKALDILDMIQTALKDAGSINLNRLEELEGEFLNVNATIMSDLQLDEKMETMRAFATMQERWITAYQTDISEIRAEIASVEAIRDSLPNFCPNIQVLEP